MAILAKAQSPYDASWLMLMRIMLRNVPATTMWDVVADLTLNWNIEHKIVFDIHQCETFFITWYSHDKVRKPFQRLFFPHNVFNPLNSLQLFPTEGIRNCSSNFAPMFVPIPCKWIFGRTIFFKRNGQRVQESRHCVQLILVRRIFQYSSIEFNPRLHVCTWVDWTHSNCDTFWTYFFLKTIEYNNIVIITKRNLRGALYFWP